MQKHQPKTTSSLRARKGVAIRNPSLPCRRLRGGGGGRASARSEGVGRRLSLCPLSRCATAPPCLRTGEPLENGLPRRFAPRNDSDRRYPVLLFTLWQSSNRVGGVSDTRPTKIPDALPFSPHQIGIPRSTTPSVGHIHHCGIRFFCHPPVPVRNGIPRMDKLLPFREHGFTEIELPILRHIRKNNFISDPRMLFRHSPKASQHHPIESSLISHEKALRSTINQAFYLLFQKWSYRFRRILMTEKANRHASPLPS